MITKTYYVVAQMGLIIEKLSATDYMLETILLVYYLLFIKTNLLKDVKRISLLIFSENNNNTKFEKNFEIQSAGNLLW